MGGKAHGGMKVSLDEAHALYEEIFELIQFKVNKIQLCGSARRKKKICGDLDIVVVPNSFPEDLNSFFVETFGYQKSGKPAKTGLFKGVQVEFYVATPFNYGSFLQMWTGSAYHNISLRRKSKKMGYSMSQYGMRHIESNDLIRFDNEEKIYKFLNIDYVLPENR